MPGARKPQSGDLIEQLRQELVRVREELARSEVERARVERERARLERENTRLKDELEAARRAGARQVSTVMQNSPVVVIENSPPRRVLDFSGLAAIGL